MKESKNKIQIGDYVRITNPLPEYKSLFKNFRYKIGKVISNDYKDAYRVYFSGESVYGILFYNYEIKKISKEEYFAEVL